MAQFDKILKLLRNEKNMSQQELADALGISKSSINMYERGERQPNFEVLETIADFFNVDIDYLLGRTNKTTKIINPNTIAAHFDGDEYTPEELDEIKAFAEFVKSKRK
jgi:transcriptional regulator with XRE-family HTH domain|uniref:Repressor protein n=1 Tax=Myoviridae sp. ctzc413 TaxID=2826721 RepID=A0A8S5NRJ0_9CAUD|nr:MAG: helix-turn-helix domain protein [Bacteriophage sp.]DAD97313.1 MAG TPA: repressor protein [Myoviridae sp. ctzc413]DAH65229.1 MAG TPA: repressor protein [Caudoviricetes sp.]DAW08451.1 MAG TPA: repressor protein [Caudoviricetes sp.]DAY70868.1 MAG TPA: repressor protein [Caudoviricetes sp.]